ncbi:hypothetical protein LZ32DRAFT_585622 [Colletotrichum eremochloae]|nr:hypothetical protein LZ32DRAFT_585622 [Colletotrichum eremochloae]
MPSYPRPLHFEGFRIAIICALALEYDATILVFDEIWNDDADGSKPTLRQHNNHTLGRIGVHNVVLVILPNMGKVSAANEVVRLRSIYPALELAFLTGICGGVPSPGTDKEMLLGDVVIGKSIIQYDLGRQYPSKFSRKDTIDDNLSRLNKDVRSFLATYETQYGRNGLQSQITKILAEVQHTSTTKQAQSCYDRPEAGEDILFKPDYLHRHRNQPSCGCNESVACDSAIKASCVELGCDVRHQTPRKRLRSKRPEPHIHIGRIGSGDTVMKSGEHRDRLAQEHGIIAFEMEGAGVWEEIPCIIVKGVCDYADSHKNKLWQDFAAAIAASATKALIERYVCRAPRISYVNSVDSTPAVFTLAPILAGVVGAIRFVGRGNEIERLHEALKWTGNRRTAVLQGLGGMGKTQLSIEYTRRHRSDYSATLWLNARDETSLKQSFQQAARRIAREYPTVAYVQNAIASQNFDETAEAVKRWLGETGNDRWLVIYDNYDDVRFDGHGGTGQSAQSVVEQSGTIASNTSQTEAAGSKAYDIRPYFPETDHGAIIITTRSSRVRLGQLIRLGKLSNVEDSLAILESTSNRTHLSQNPDAYTLARRLDGLPLALSTAGAYLNQVSTTFAEYLQLYDKSWLRLHKESPQLLDYDQALYSTWGVSFNYIQQQSRGAAMLLRLWAYFDNEDLWYELLQEAGSEGPVWLQDITKDKLEFNAAMRVLCEHGLVEADPPTKESGEESRGYSVHGCVHAWMIHVLNTEGDEEMSFTAMRCVASHVLTLERQEYWIVQRRLVRHADRCITRTATDAAGNDEAWMFHNFGILYSDQYRLKEAEAMYKRALQGYEEALGPDIGTLHSIHCLGILYSDQDRLKEAKAMYEQALQGYEKALGPEHTSTLNAVNNLGVIYTSQGQLKEAEAMHKRALQGYKKALGPEHTSTLKIVNNLGSLYSNQGRFKEAEAMYKQALQGYEKAIGPEHTLTLKTVNNLGILYSDQGRLKKAKAMYERALQGYEKALGLEHTSTLNTVNSLGKLYSDQGQLKEAEAMYKQVLQGYKKALGPEHTSTLKIVNNLGSVYSDQGRLKEAEAMYKQALQGYEKALGPDAIRTYIPALNTLQNLGSLFKKLGENGKAISYYQQAQKGFLSVLGSENERYIYISGKLGSLQISAQERDVSPSVEEARRGLKGRWNRLKRHVKGT